MPSVAHLLRPDIAALEPYTPVVPPDVLAARLGLPIERIIKLDANENPYGPAPRVAEALARAGAGAPNPYAIYPDPDQAQLREALSHYTGQPVERIICGAGSDEIIDLLMRAFLQPGEAIIDCPPTFGMYTFDAGLVAARVANVPRDASFDLDLEGIAEAAEQGAKLLFVAAPNNPTGNPLPRQAVERLLELPLLVVIDEAYAEFAGASVAGMVGSYPNLVVLRTFSKWAGLAGLRIGYGLIHEELIAHLWKIKQPYNINAAAQIAALASLEDREYLRGNVVRIVAERERLYAALQAQPGLHVYPSRANFLLCRLTTTDQGPPTTDSRDTVTRRQGDRVTELGETVTPSPLHPFTPSEQSVVGGQSSVVGGQSSRAAALKETLMRRGILVRYYNKPGLSDCIRISIGTPEQNDAALAALAEALTTSV